MQQKKINPIIRCWVTPKLPIHDVFELPLLQNKSLSAKYTFLFSQWLIHPIKRRLARWYLKLLKKFTDIKIIAVTGSAGKSTTSQMIFSILENAGRTISTLPGLDSVFNIPNTILRTPWGTKFIILEMSVEYPGEMDYYLWLAKPDIGVIINIYPTHLQFLGNIEGVLKEKGKLILNLSESGVAFLNSGDQNLVKFAKKINKKIVWFHPNPDPIIQNSLAAESVATYLGISRVSVRRGIENYKKPPHRLDILKLKNGTVILDDTYSSNPKSALSTLRYFNKITNEKKIAVLGDMLELGKYDEQAHRELGREIAKLNFEVVVGVGKSAKFLIDEVNKKSKKTKTYLFSNTESATQTVKELIKKNASVLVKGSRSIGLDRLIAKLS